MSTAQPVITLAGFCHEQHARLVGVLSLYTGDCDLAEELAQDALVKVCRHWERVRAMDQPAAWATAVALNLARSSFRSTGARRRALVRVAGRVEHEQRADPPDAASRVAIRTAVAALPERQRRAILLRYYADLSVREVAALMSCPEGTVKTLTAQAIAALRTTGLEVEE